MTAEQICPLVNDLNRPFWQAVEDGRFLLPYCTATGQFFWPPGATSPFVFPGAVAWKPAAITGVLKALAIYRRAFQKAFAPMMPYGIGLIALDAGPRMQVHIPRPDNAAAPKPGERVMLYFAAAVAGGAKIPMARRLEPMVSAAL
jgi:uncharacterized protein